MKFLIEFNIMFYLLCLNIVSERKFKTDYVAHKVVSFRQPRVFKIIKKKSFLLFLKRFLMHFVF